MESKSQQFPPICLGKLTEQQAQDISNQYDQGLTKEQILHLDQKGYLVIPDILSKQEQLEAISELWDILEAVPNKGPYKIIRPENPLESLPKQQIQELTENWVPWKGVGMLSEPWAFHTKAHWKLRQSEKLYKMFTQILQNEKLWATIDRATVKLPDKGIEEFNHWDFDPWHPTKAEIQGIVNLSERNFRCVPGSNTEEWHNDFKKQYTYLESKEVRSQILLKKKQDPWNLGQILEENSQNQKPKTKYNCIRNIVCPPGSIVLFSQRTMHSVAKNNSDRISYGLYLSFFEARNKLSHGVFNKAESCIHAVEGDSERGDRIRSYQQGTSTYKYPFGAGVHHYIYQKTVKHFIHIRQQASLIPDPVTKRPTILEPLPQDYKPCELTALGRLVLGLDLYPGMEDQPMKLTQQDIDQIKPDQN